MVTDQESSFDLQLRQSVVENMDYLLLRTPKFHID